MSSESFLISSFSSLIMGKAKAKFRAFMEKYSQHIELNRNILLGSVSSLACASLCNEFAKELYKEPWITTALTSAAQNLSFFAVYAPLHFRMKRGEFRQNGKTNWKKYWKDIGKIYLVGLPANITFNACFAGGNYYLLMKGAEAKTASIVSYVGSYIPAQTMMTYIADRSKMVRTDANTALH